MFVTCFYAPLETSTGQLRCANAGHDLPFHRNGDGVCELCATGMPLGLMPGMSYEQHEAALEPGDCVLFYSDGIVEAHNAQREMFGFPRLMRLVEHGSTGDPLVEHLLAELTRFTGPSWTQEDDVNPLALLRVAHLGDGPERE